MTDTVDEIPLSAVAEDAREMIQAFRELGNVAFDAVPLPFARANYEATCLRNGLGKQALPLVRDHRVELQDKHLFVREYRPSMAAALPATLFVHGGGWVIGNLETHDAICRLLAHASGAAVFAVAYGLAPEHPFPMPLQDCATALRWLIERAQDLGIDTRRLAVAGDSAGGNLAAVLANTAELRPDGFDFGAQALFYPVTDLSREAESYARIRSGFPLTATPMRLFRDHYVPAGVDLADPKISPLLATAISSAPLFILSCGLDPLCDEGIAYAERSIRAGVRVEHHHLARHAHGILTSAGLVAAGRTIILRAAAFLAEQLHHP